jgi:hypothetical protein
LLREKICSVLTTGALNAMVLLELPGAGRWRKHVDRLQTRLGAARNAASRQLRHSVQRGVQPACAVGTVPGSAAAGVGEGPCGARPGTAVRRSFMPFRLNRLLEPIAM